VIAGGVLKGSGGDQDAGLHETFQKGARKLAKNTMRRNGQPPSCCGSENLG
jgi:hypothetical protein